MVEITVVAAFLAGIASFLSPCVLPLIPAFLTYLGGVSVKNLQSKEFNFSSRLKIFLNAVFFVLGFSVVFALAGTLLSSFLLPVSYEVRLWMGRIGGIIIVLFGLFVLGLVRMPFLEREYKLQPSKTRYAYLTSFIFGATFAIGWTPCVGAILGGILTLAFTQPGSAFTLLTSYAIGLGIPFLLVGAFTPEALRLIRAHGKWSRYFDYLMGVILIIIGILVFFDKLSTIANLAFAGGFLGS